MDEEDTYATNKNIKDEGDTIPPMDYVYVSDVNFKYTYFRYFNLKEDDYIQIHATGLGLYYALEFFSFNKPENYSYIAYSNPGYIANLSVTIPENGYYILKITGSGYGDFVKYIYNINYGSDHYVNKCVISNTGVTYEHSAFFNTYNYFTTDLTGDSHMWITDNSGKIRAHNDNFMESDSFDWNLNSRIIIDFNIGIKKIQISSHVSYWPSGKCDLYLQCKNVNPSYISFFPGLQTIDGIKSADATTNYNCFAWAGGYWLDTWDPYRVGLPWSDPDPLVSLDKYYGNYNIPRYEGATNYIRTEDPEISLIDIYYTGSDYTHASVSGSANGHPHGYAWESKWSNGERFFHPRYALESSSMKITHYFTPVSPSESNLSFGESLAKGLSVIEKVELNNSEKECIERSINSLTPLQLNGLEKRYKAWKLTWGNPEISMHSVLRMYAKSKEYDDFIDYCKLQGESVWPYVFNKFVEGDKYAVNAIEDLTMEANRDKVDKMITECSRNSRTKSGALIVRPSNNYTIRYIKELLKSKYEITDEEIKVQFSNSFEFDVSPNPVNANSSLSFDLETVAKVSAQVRDLNGRVISNIIKEQMIDAGSKNYPINLSENYKGTYLVELIINGIVNVKLIVVP